MQHDDARPRAAASALVGCATVAALVVAACARQDPPTTAALPAHIGAAQQPAVDPVYGVPASPRVVQGHGPLPRGGGVYKLGKPYQVAGRWYVPREEPAYDQVGIASWYGPQFHGRKTANGEVFDMEALAAAHPTLPLPSYVSVTNVQNGRTILVRVNDRGPYAHGRLIDLSRRAARELGLEVAGTGTVRVSYQGRAPLDGDDGRERAFLAAQPWSSRSGEGIAARAPTRWPPVAAAPAGPPRVPAAIYAR